MRRLTIAGVAVAASALVATPGPTVAGTPPEPGNGRGLFVVEDAEAQFRALKHHGEALGWWLNEQADAPDASQHDHYQGVVRYPGAGIPVFFVTQKQDDGGYLHVVRLGGRPETGERVRSNLQKIGDNTEKTLPTDENATWVRSVRFDGTLKVDGKTIRGYAHPGGLTIVDNVLWMALDSPLDATNSPIGYILLFDLSGNCEDPTPLQALALTHKIDNLAVTEQPDGTFLVWVNGDGGQFTKFYATTEPNLRDDELVLDLVQDWKNDESDDYDGNGSDWPVGTGAHQGSTFLREPDGSLYMIGMRRGGLAGLGSDWADLYRVFPKAGAGCKLARLHTSRFECVYDYTDRICNFAAADNAYVSPSGELVLYSVPHDDQDWPRTDFVRMAEFRHRDVSRDSSALRSPTAAANGPYTVVEGGTAALTGSASPAVDRPWVELYDDTRFEDRSIVVDYDDHDKLELANFNDLDGFGDKTSSVRWRAPVGLNIELYDDRDYADRHIILYGTGETQEVSDLKTQGVVLGRVEQRDPGKAKGEKLDFNDETSSLRFTGSPPALRFRWDLDGDGLFGEDGPRAARGDETGTRPTFSAAGLDGPSVQRVTFQACYGSDRCATSSTDVNVLNVRPAVDAGGSQLASEGAIVGLDPATFSDPGSGEPTAFSATVNWGDGTSAPPGNVSLVVTPDGGDTTTGTVQANHAYADDGTYTVTVCVTDDDDGRTCDTCDVTVSNVSPNLSAGQDQTVYEGDVVTLDRATFSDPGFDNPATPTQENFVAAVEWGDGTTEPADGITLVETPGGEGVPTVGTIAASHAYPAPGVYTVKVSVSDSDGGMDEDTLTVTVLHGYLRFCAYMPVSLRGR